MQVRCLFHVNDAETPQRTLRDLYMFKIACFVYDLCFNVMP